MKNIRLILITLFLLIGNYISSQNVYIPDANFKNKLIELGIDTNNDGEISYEEAAEVDFYLNVESSEIEDLTGIKSFVSIKTLDVSGNYLSDIDISGMNLLKWLICDDNKLESFNFQASGIRTFDCQNNLLTEIDVSGITSLKSIDCSNNYIEWINTFESGVTSLNCSNNYLSELEVFGHSEYGFSGLKCNNNQISELKFHGEIDELECFDNLIETISIRGAKSIKLANNKLKYLDISGCYGLEHLNIGNNPEFEQLCVYKLPITFNLIDYQTPDYKKFVCNPIPGDNFFAGQKINVFHHYNNINLSVTENQYDINYDGFPDVKLSLEIIDDPTWSKVWKYKIQAINDWPASIQHEISSEGYNIYGYETIYPENITVWLTSEVTYFGIVYYYLWGEWEYSPIDYFALRSVQDSDTTYTWIRFQKTPNYEEVFLKEVASWKRYNQPNILGGDTTILISTNIDLYAEPNFDFYYWSTRDTTNPISISGIELGIGEWPVFVYVNDSNYFYEDSMIIKVVENYGVEDWILHNVTIRPNPFKNILSIYNPFNQELSLELFDINGRKLIQKDVENDLLDIDASFLPPGIYIGKLSDKNNSRVIKLVKY